MAQVPSIFHQADPTFVGDVTQEMASALLQEGSWVVIQNPADFNATGIPTPFFGRYQARKVKSVYTPKGLAGAYVELAREGAHSLSSDYAQANQVVFLGDEAHVGNLAMAMTMLDVIQKQSLTMALKTGGDVERNGGFLKQFMGAQGMTDSYHMVTPSN